MNSIENSKFDHFKNEVRQNSRKITSVVKILTRELRVFSGTTGLNRQALTPNEIKYDESFLLPMEKRVYNEQYANMYILKIEELRQKAFNQGHKSWNDMIANGNRVQHSEKTLDVGKHRICWTVGTVYCDMDLKPSILEEVSKSVSISLLPFAYLH